MREDFDPINFAFARFEGKIIDIPRRVETARNFTRKRNRFG
jgi:hypothetical protein